MAHRLDALDARIDRRVSDVRLAHALGSDVGRPAPPVGWPSRSREKPER